MSTQNTLTNKLDSAIKEIQDLKTENISLKDGIKDGKRLRELLERYYESVDNDTMSLSNMARMALLEKSFESHKLISTMSLELIRHRHAIEKILNLEVHNTPTLFDLWNELNPQS